MSRARSRVRWTSVVLGAAIVGAALVVPAIHTPQAHPGVRDCSAGRPSDLDAVLVLDSSESMSVSDPDGLRKLATTAFVNGMSAQARSGRRLRRRGQVVQGLTS